MAWPCAHAGESSPTSLLLVGGGSGGLAVVGRVGDALPLLGEVGGDGSRRADLVAASRRLHLLLEQAGAHDSQSGTGAAVAGLAWRYCCEGAELRWERSFT